MAHSTSGPLRRLVVSAGSVVLAAGLLVACSGGEEGTNNGSYISGDGRVRTIGIDQRETAPIELAGESLEGEPIDLADHRGRVVVVNTWWSGCPPCRTEMPMLVEAAAELADEADFIGINIRDNSVDQGLAFERAMGVTYPSIYAVDGQATLAFADVTNMRSVPTTLVLDREGRVAAVINGEIPGRKSLVDVVEEIAAEDV